MRTAPWVNQYPGTLICPLDGRVPRSPEDAFRVGNLQSGVCTGVVRRRSKKEPPDLLLH